MRVILSNIVAIYRKELQGYFASPLAYAIAGVFWLLSGFFFVIALQDTLQTAAAADQIGQPFDAAYALIQAFLGLMGVLSLFILPILSMGLYAEERKRGTLELLATSPVTNWVVSLGKLLGVLTFFITLVLPLLVYETITLSAANPPLNPTLLLTGYGGLILMAAAVLSLGMFLSSLTESSILAAILTFALVLLLWSIQAIATVVGGPVGDAIGHLSLLKHYGDLVRGVVNTSGLILFVSYIILGLFLTAQSIEALRFQRS
ncbi:ABC transporter permease subunit [Trichocoleus sp. FACHB-591]|uniref:ABC transporter permease n=1 Tax=Trichocoleus sp. FACHB-591 TaxID=2692872 RepID=UPI001688CF57|nr:ABC transporter permease [Trichocoleus sp. FACHB-591]MBD2093951.1 ABC transporter permease subunit [Trichocoleus sp. FACHB-591]